MKTIWEDAPILVCSLITIANLLLYFVFCSCTDFPMSIGENLGTVMFVIGIFPMLLIFTFFEIIFLIVLTILYIVVTIELPTLWKNLTEIDNKEL